MDNMIEYIGTLDREIFEMQEACRKDIERITGIADLEGLNLQGEKEARRRQFNLSVEAIRKQREAIVKAMVEILSLQAPQPTILPPPS